MTFHVLVPDDVDAAALDILNAAEGLKVTYTGKISQEKLKELIPDAEALMIRSGVKITADVFEAAPNLKAIARAGVGVDNVDLEAATRHGVVVMNTPGGNTIATAELTLGLMLALARFIPQGDATLKAGKWERKNMVGVELRGKTLGIVGFGRIGKAVAARAKAFEMKVIAHDPFVEDGGDLATMVTLDELFAQSDFITLHSVITPETKHLINRANIAKMKDGVRIVNAARGALINDQDLAEALKIGKVAGAAVDVYDVEPPPPDHPLLNAPNVIDTPHLGASTVDAQITVAIEAAELIRDFFLKGSVNNVCNPDVIRS
ncbi:hydroxyacid dehydrogenase [Aggregatilineales bacterium SYSU G02658]